MKLLKPHVKARMIRRARKGQNAWRTPKGRRADAEASRKRNLAVLEARRPWSRPWVQQPRATFAIDAASIASGAAGVLGL